MLFFLFRRHNILDHSTLGAEGKILQASQEFNKRASVYQTRRVDAHVVILLCKKLEILVPHVRLATLEHVVGQVEVVFDLAGGKAALVVWIIQQIKNHVAVVLAADQIPDEVAEHNTVSDILRQLVDQDAEGIVEGVDPIDEALKVDFDSRAGCLHRQVDGSLLRHLHLELLPEHFRLLRAHLGCKAGADLIEGACIPCLQGWLRHELGRLKL